jgi:RNA polymerase sigma factor (sigma-70 family)
MMAQDGGWARRRPGTRGERSPDGGVSEPPGTRELRVVSDDMYSDWQAVYQDNVERIYRLMFSKVGNRADAEDLTAEVFLAALRPLRVSASVGEVRAYLLAIARTVLARHWRTTMGREITTIDDDYPEPTPDAESVSAAPQRAEAALRGLPERYRRVLTLRFLHSYSVKDAAAALGISVANTKVLQHRALRRAAELSEEEQA